MVLPRPRGLCPLLPKERGQRKTMPFLYLGENNPLFPLSLKQVWHQLSLLRSYLRPLLHTHPGPGPLRKTLLSFPNRYNNPCLLSKGGHQGTFSKCPVPYLLLEFPKTDKYSCSLLQSPLSALRILLKT